MLTTLGKLIKTYGLTAIEVGMNDKWTPITELLVSVGESEADYAKFVAEAKEARS